MEVIFVTAVIILLVISRLSRLADHIFPLYPRRCHPGVEDVLNLGQDPQPECQKWSKQRGDKFNANMGVSLMVVLNSYASIKEALVKKLDDFSNTMPVFFDAATGISVKGVVLSTSHAFKEQRSLALLILGKFGIRKTILTERIQDVVSTYVEYLLSLKGKPTDIRPMTNITKCNTICSIIIGHRFAYNGTQFQNLIALLNSKGLDQKNISLINLISWLKYLRSDLFMVKSVTLNINVVLDVFKKIISVYRPSEINYIGVVNFIKSCFTKRNKIVSTYTDDDNLTRILNNLFGAGTETTSATIYRCVLYMSIYPNMLEIVFREIKSQVRLNRALTMQDADSMETQELASIGPVSLFQTCSENVTLKEYSIPKGTYIIPNLDFVLFDKTTKDTDVVTLKAEEFLSVTGKLYDREKLIPPYTGNCVILGEATAKKELHLFLSNVFQRFQFL